MSRRSYGTGSLYVRADRLGRESWYGQWRAGGRRLKRCIGPKRADGTSEGLTRPQAEAELRRLMADVAVTRPAKARRTLAEVAPEYIRHLEAKGRKRSTVVAAQSCLDVWLLPMLGDRPLDGIRGEDVEDLMARMEAGDRRGGRGCAPKTIRNYIGTLSAIYRYAMHPRRRWATTNPCDAVDLPEVESDEDIRFLEPIEVAALADAAVEGPYQAIDRAFYVTAAMTGLRHGELIALRWRDVDWSAMRVRVRQNYVLGEYGTPKSRRSTRSVPMAADVGGELDRLAQRAAGGRSEPDPDDLVFADPLTGGPLSKAANNRRFRKARAAARLDEGHRIHDLRHTFGTRCAAAGVAMRTLQEWMGHRDIATTQRYADYAPSAREAELIAAAFEDRGAIRGANLSESQVTSHDLTAAGTHDAA
jgi:integrase